MSSEEIIIGNLQIIEEADCVVIQCDIISEGMPNELKCIVRGVDLESIGDLSYDWAVVALLIPGMYLGRNIVIEGRISSLLQHNIGNGLQKSLKIYEPLYNLIEIKARDVIERPKIEKKRTATGFSAGVDSFATLYLYSNCSPKTSIKVTDLCVFNAGAMGGKNEIGVAELFKNYVARADSFAFNSGLNSISIDSNIADFYDSISGKSQNHVILLNFQKTHTLRNCALALLLENYINFYLYSSAADLSDVKIGPAIDPAYMDPFLLAMLTNEHVTFISAGAALSRFEKTILVSDMHSAQSMLDVCVNSAEVRVNNKYQNCSRCWKCKRTLVSLEAIGVLERYSKVFDLNYYNNHKSSAYSYIMASAISGNAIEKEVLKRGREAGLSFSYSPISLIRIMVGILKIRGKRSSYAVKTFRNFRRKIRSITR